LFRVGALTGPLCCLVSQAPHIPHSRDIIAPMTPAQMEHFYDAALTAGSILSGFLGTFLSFRIQREASYYRQPGQKLKESILIDLSQFPISLLLILLGTVCSVVFGIITPLLASAHAERVFSPITTLAGIIASLILAGAYFFAEMFHYRMFRICDKEWRQEGWIVTCGIVLAVLPFILLRT